MRAMRPLPLILSLVLLAAPGSQVWAQEDGDTPKEAAPVERVEPVAPYDDKLLRLSEVLGALHYLRSLCGADEGNRWREAMATILSTEAPPPQRRARLTARFNRGYNGFADNYVRCTDSARTAAERYRREGIQLTAQIVSRYGR